MDFRNAPLANANRDANASAFGLVWRVIEPHSRMDIVRAAIAAIRVAVCETTASADLYFYKIAKENSQFRRAFLVIDPAACARLC
jgi:hypothetical protein